MIENFLRRPQGVGGYAADAVRLAGVASVVVAMIWWHFTDAALLALTLLGTLVPRFLAVRSSLDIAFGVTLLVGAWSSILGLYTAVAGWDLVVHFFMNGLAAAMLYLLLARRGIAPTPSPKGPPLITLIVLTTALGISLGVLWEFAEWWGHTFIDQTIHVGYEDTLGDLAAGGLGSAIAGASLRLFIHEPNLSRRDVSPPNQGDRVPL